MPFRINSVKLDKSAGPIRRALQYAFYDWASELPRSKRIIMYLAIVLQGYAFYFTLMWALILPKWMYSPLAMAQHINKHLSRYTPSDRFATAVIVVLNRDSGELTCVNAGHNAPILSLCGSTTFLEATGPPLGLFVDALYEPRTAVIGRGGTLLMFTDGLTDSIRGEHPDDRLRDAFAETAERTMANLKSLVDPKFNRTISLYCW